MAKILIADDDPEFLFFFREMVLSRDHDCDCVTNGDAAIELLKRRQFDIVFLDMLMPRRGAISTLHAVREIDPEIPVVIISGNPVVFESPIVRDGLQLAHAKMPKLADVHKLSEMIERLVDEPKRASDATRQ